MIRQNLHTHSIWDDGEDTMERMVLAAEAVGLTSLGFSIHTPMPFPACWTISRERLPDYRTEALRLREAFHGRIAVYCGAEWDLLSEPAFGMFDFVIGSIHCVGGDRDCYADVSPETTARYLAQAFRGDADAAAEAYFAQYAALAAVDKVNIVGHFDLITKFDESDHFFQSDSPRFRAAAIDALDALVAADKIFEINTGAISRGYRTTPYPSRALLNELRKRDGRITISADAHCTQHVAYGFAEAEALAISCGFSKVWQFDGRGFVPEPIGGSA